MKITLEQAEQVRPIVQRIAKARWELDDAANELEAALGQYFSVTRGSEFLDGEEELTAERVQEWVEELEELRLAQCGQTGGGACRRRTARFACRVGAV
jgi:hypothetical protein